MSASGGSPDGTGRDAAEVAGMSVGRPKASGRATGTGGSEPTIPAAVPLAVPAPEVYAPEGYPACPFCGNETGETTSKVMYAGHLAIERMVAADPGSSEFWAARIEVASFTGGDDV